MTVEESERLAERLRSTGITCEILNAKNDEQEARIVARAGAFGAVTISTNMAGRGTDIRLGGEDEGSRERVAALGGLYVIGTNRHESRRVDLQLRGRAGRQGDPGESRFFLSLEDDLLVRYGIQNLLHGRVVPGRRDQPIDDPIVSEEIARAQRIIEGQNFEIRKTLARYSSVVEDQHRVLMERRQALLHGHEVPDVWKNAAPERYAALVASSGEDAVERAERTVTLFHIDRVWRDHLAYCADLREGIHLVSLGGMDPLSRFTSDVMAAFRQVEEIIDKAVLETLPLVTVWRWRTRSGSGGNQGTVIHVDVPGERRPVPQSDPPEAHRPWRDDDGDLLVGAPRTFVSALGRGRALPSKGPRPARRSVSRFMNFAYTFALVLCLGPLPFDLAL